MGEWGKPYLTLDKDYESEQINAFAKIVKSQRVIYRHKPVHWCLDCKSALAEAEVEYQDKDSLSVDVSFRVIDNENLLIVQLENYKPESNIIPIWTTTHGRYPQMRLLFLENIEYSIFETTLNNERIICLLATELLETNLKKWGVDLIGEPKNIDPSVFGRINVRTLYIKQVPILIGDYVTTENGTGAVHTAPAHGQDDFVIGKKNNLDSQML